MIMWATCNRTPAASAAITDHPLPPFGTSASPSGYACSLLLRPGQFLDVALGDNSYRQPQYLRVDSVPGNRARVNCGRCSRYQLYQLFFIHLIFLLHFCPRDGPNTSLVPKRCQPLFLEVQTKSGTTIGSNPALLRYRFASDSLGLI